MVLRFSPGGSFYARAMKCRRSCFVSSRQGEAAASAGTTTIAVSTSCSMPAGRIPTTNQSPDTPGPQPRISQPYPAAAAWLYRRGMEETLEAWFTREILAHEEALVRYLSRHWPRQSEILDLRQEVYIRVYETARAGRPLTPRAFLFTTARNLLVDRVRRQRIVSIDAVGDLESLNVLVDELSPEHRVHARQELRRLMQAFDALPPRCREAVWMRRVDQLPQKEIAARLGITEKVVEKHITLGMRRLADAMLRGQDSDETDAHGRTLGQGEGNGKP